MLMSRDSRRSRVGALREPMGETNRMGVRGERDRSAEAEGCKIKWLRPCWQLGARLTCMPDLDSLSIQYIAIPPHTLEMEHSCNLPQRPQSRRVEVVADADDRALQGRQPAASASLASAAAYLGGPGPRTVLGPRHLAIVTIHPLTTT